MATTKAFTTRNLFDAVFERFLPAGAVLNLDDDDDADKALNAPMDAPRAAVEARVDDADTAQGANGDDTMVDSGSQDDPGDDTTDSDAAAAATQPWLSLDTEDLAVLEAQALGTDAAEETTLRAEEAAALHKAQQQLLDQQRLSDEAAGQPGTGGPSGHNRRGPPNAAAGNNGSMTAEEQLERMPVDGPEVFTGACVLFNHSKGFGFIAPDVGGPDVYYTREGIHLSYSRALDDWLGASAAHDTGATDVQLQQRRALESGLRLLQLSKPFLVGGERVAFRVSSNAQGGGGGGGGSSRRKLRAVDITGPDGGPITLERVVLGLVRAGAPFASGAPAAAAGTDTAHINNPVGPSGAEADTTVVAEGGSVQQQQQQQAAQPATVALLPYRTLPAMSEGPDAPEPLSGERYSGWVKNLSSDGDRGYIRPDPAALSASGVVDTAAAACSLDAVLYMDVVVWASRVSMDRRVLEEGVLVDYHVVGFDKNRKPVAAVVTGHGGTPLDPHEWQLTEVAKRRKAEAVADGGGGDDADGVHGDGRRSDGGALRRKRGRGEDASGGDAMMLLLADEDGGYV